MPVGSVAGAVEQRLRAKAATKKLKGKRADQYVYGAMNNMGLMHGNKTTRKGMRDYSMARRH